MISASSDWDSSCVRFVALFASFGDLPDDVFCSSLEASPLDCRRRLLLVGGREVGLPEPAFLASSKPSISASVASSRLT